MTTFRLSTWDLGAVLFDGETTAGPVPTLFTDSVEVSKAAREAAPVKAHADYMKIARTFFMPETISMEDALGVVKKPR